MFASALKTLASIVVCIKMIRRWLCFTWSTLACIDCNLHKGTNLTGIDPQTNEITELFHPRRQLWDEHFEWQGIYLTGKTPTGRTTIRVLNMNSEDQIALRSS